jgi:hypothetical protein
VAGKSGTGNNAEGDGNDKQLLICGICLFLPSAAALLLAWVVLLKFLHISVAAAQAALL